MGDVLRSQKITPAARAVGWRVGGGLAVAEGPLQHLLQTGLGTLETTVEPPGAHREPPLRRREDVEGNEVANLRCGECVNLKCVDVRRAREWRSGSAGEQGEGQKRDEPRAHSITSLYTGALRKKGVYCATNLGGNAVFLGKMGKRVLDF